MKIFKYIIEALIIYSLLILFKIIGLNFARKLSSSLLVKIGFFFRKKKLITENIKRVFKNYSDFEIEKIIRSMWSNYGCVFAEYMHLDKFRFDKFPKKHIRFSGEEKINKMIKDNKPAVFISGHFGGFEMMAMELEKRKINLVALYRPLNNIFLNPLMVHLRKKYICKNQVKKGLSGTREIINFVKNNHSIALMVDQRVGESERYPFFNIPAHTTTIPAQIAIKFDLDIVPIYLKREDDNSFLMEFQNPIKIKKTGNDDEDKKIITNKINDVVEKMVLRNPGQWIWTHSRWK